MVPARASTKKPAQTKDAQLKVEKDKVDEKHIKLETVSTKTLEQKAPKNVTASAPANVTAAQSAKNITIAQT